MPPSEDSPAVQMQGFHPSLSALSENAFLNRGRHYCLRPRSYCISFTRGQKNHPQTKLFASDDRFVPKRSGDLRMVLAFLAKSFGKQKRNDAYKTRRTTDFYFWPGALYSKRRLLGLNRISAAFCAVLCKGLTRFYKRLALRAAFVCPANRRLLNGIPKYNPSSAKCVFALTLRRNIKKRTPQRKPADFQQCSLSCTMPAEP
jgi:hypothetical protein